MEQKQKRSAIARGYLHGFSTEEQERLYEQARFYEKKVFSTLDLSTAQNLLEVGSGVGAQTEILLERFPHLEIACVDAAKAQMDRAKKHLRSQEGAGRVSFHLGDALNLPFPSDHFDAAFLCWFLEHVSDPIGVLREVRRVLRPGGMVFCNETQNSSFFVDPYSPATLKYWFEFNDHQWTLKGDPFVGAKLANHLLAAGYQNIETRVLVEHHDNRRPKTRAIFIDEWIALLLSGAPAMIKTGRVSVDLVEEMKHELTTLKDDPNSVFIYEFYQATAQAL